MERESYKEEINLTNEIYNSLSGKYEADFADNGREIFVRNRATNECFTISINQDTIRAS